ncbi:hypothetical protein SAICODRAFT_208766 [Saitoella complicata NRRL Y-17804]|nr:uncharacterized protein SAICODRAFT_208766 [Saitoella complicata NRRL Y-17804]ODQ54360.1 hypothetical protein SAICODRAFT_208766 [Saitoella complicata NRRL Y-17804]
MITLKDFSHRLGPLLLRNAQPGQRLGMAVSGGVDSMALTYLTHLWVKEQNIPSNYVTAITIDHDSRPESAAEAAKVGEWCAQFGFQHHIIKLDWSKAKDVAPTRFELHARQLRYEALSRACIDKGVTKLLFAHHSDDQAETLLHRLAMGSSFMGLSGMPAVAPIPCSHNIYGAQHIEILRPLLGFRKSDLKATCKAANVPWAEDPTNNDATLTIRNTIRKLFAERAHELPEVLQPQNLVKLSQRLRADEDRAEIYLKDQLELSRLCFFPQSGAMYVTVPPHIMQQTEDIRFRFAAIIAQKLTPSVGMIRKGRLKETVDRLFTAKDDRVSFRNLLFDVKSTQLLGQQILWFVRRAPLDKESMKKLVPLPTDGTWELWDGRWFIRLSLEKGKTLRNRICVRCLSPRDLRAVRLLMSPNDWAKWNRSTDHAMSGDTQFQIPLAVEVCDKEDGTQEEVRPVALPSLNIQLQQKEGIFVESRFRAKSGQYANKPIQLGDPYNLFTRGSSIRRKEEIVAGSRRVNQLRSNDTFYGH